MNTDLMDKKYYDLKYKDCLPEQTIQKICDILKRLKIEVVEEWIEDNELGTSSLRIHVKDCEAVGTNGKGTNRLYAKASAYAEFMERVQNMILSSSQVVSSVFYNEDADFYICKDEKYLSADELIDQNSSYIQMYMETRGLANAERNAKVNAFLNLERMDYYITKKYNRFLCIPFYSIKEEKYVYLPYYSYRVHYGSNGMSAGNTPEEALVQGLAEIFERVINKKAINEMVSFPDIPDDYIRLNYPDIYEYLCKAREDNSISVIAKDCSCGGKYPVVGLVFIEENTGYYGIKFGSHPNTGIALERCFTEATQGQKLKQFCRKAKLDFHNENVFTVSNLLNGYRSSDCKYSYQVFNDQNTYSFYNKKLEENDNNKEILSDLLKGVLEKGYDILIHDASYFGFPTYHIIIPTVSETERKSDKTINKHHDYYLARKLILNVTNINKKNVRFLSNTLAYASKYFGSNTLSTITGCDYEYPAREYNSDAVYLYCMCNFIQGEYELAEKGMKIICDMKPEREGIKYNAMQDYFAGMSALNDHKKVINYLKLFYEESTCIELDDLLSEAADVIKKQYPVIGEGSAEYRQYCKVACVIEDIYNKYIEEQIKSNYDMNEIIKVIQNLDL